jgi:leader peptidase (prepilin peptidase) / N-methyltransferase
MVVFFIFLFGLLVGSFLNVVIYRLPRNESIVFPPSHCPHCRHHLAWYDLFPVLSYFFLKGKCRYCHVHISSIYPFVELVTAVIFVTTFWLTIPTGILYTIYVTILMCLFLIIFFTDYQHGVIPLYVVLFGLVISLIYMGSAYPIGTIFVHILSALGAFIFFFLLFYFTKGRGMGFGDVMLVLLLGLIVGFPNIILALYISFLTGAAVSLLLILRGNKHLRRDTIPFGPFLILGAYVSLFWGEKIFAVVMNYLLK